MNIKERSGERMVIDDSFSPLVSIVGFVGFFFAYVLYVPGADLAGPVLCVILGLFALTIASRSMYLEIRFRLKEVFIKRGILNMRRETVAFEDVVKVGHRTYSSIKKGIVTTTNGVEFRSMKLFYQVSLVLKNGKEVPLHAVGFVSWSDMQNFGSEVAAYIGVPFTELGDSRKYAPQPRLGDEIKESFRGNAQSQEDAIQ